MAYWMIPGMGIALPSGWIIISPTGKTVPGSIMGFIYFGFGSSFFWKARKGGKKKRILFCWRLISFPVGHTLA